MTFEEILKENQKKIRKEIEEREKRYKKEQLFIAVIGTFIILETSLIMYLMAR